MNAEARLQISQEARKEFGRRVVVARHDLCSSQLFSDESLVELLDAHPRELLFAIAMGTNPAREENQLASHQGVSGRELLEAVRNGRLWLNVTRIDRVDRRFRELVAGLYAALGREVQGFSADSVQATLLVSSPEAIVYYHADGPPNVLWHVRGRKKVWVYPALDERFLLQRDLEDIFAGARHEYLPYEPSFDAAATCVELEEGQFISWPQNSPHRVTNLAGLNVSLSTEHFTAQSRARARLYAANRFLRHSFRLPALSTREAGPVAFAKVALHGIVKRAGLGGNPGAAKRREPVVRVAPGAPLGIAALPPRS